MVTNVDGPDDDESTAQCCFYPMTTNCPGPDCEANRMYIDELPRQVQWEGTFTSDDDDKVQEGTTADRWGCNVALGFAHQQWYFNASDHTTLILDYTSVDMQGQKLDVTDYFVNGGRIDQTDQGIPASTFDYSMYDCSAQCSSSQGEALLNRAGRRGGR